MPGMRRPGMDHDYYDWSPIVARPPIHWPDNARVALCVVVCLEHYEWQLPADAFMPSNMPGGLGRGAFPDIRSFSHREYGNRVGVFRLLQLLDRYGIKGTVALDAAVASNYPFIVQECLKRGWEFIGHGLTVNRMVTSKMSEEQERQYIRESIMSVATATGRRPAGWFGPEYGESDRTPNLLAQEGIRYVCDWPNDEQPYAMKTAMGTLYSLPMSLDLDDVVTHWNRHVPIMQYSQMVRESFDRLYIDGTTSGRMMVFNLHPWLIGQPFRIKYLDLALAHISKHQGVWKATGGEIIDWYAAHR